MCGRFVRVSSLPIFKEEFGVSEFINVPLEPHYNIAPSRYVEAIIDDKGERRMGPMKWGFNSPSTRSAPINARAETVATNPVFRDAFRYHRCLIVADGFYEWKKDGATKTPYFIHLRSGRPFSFAGIWKWDRTEVGQRFGTCAIVTCPPNELMAHTRMPVILPETARKTWLDRNSVNRELREILAPLPAEQMEAYPVSTYVNRPENDSAECVRRVG